MPVAWEQFRDITIGLVGFVVSGERVRGGALQGRVG